MTDASHQLDVHTCPAHAGGPINPAAPLQVKVTFLTAARLPLFALLAVITGCPGAPPTISIGEEAETRAFELAVGQTATLRGGTLTFLGIARDDRCPRGRECAESGLVTVRLRPGAGPEIELSILDRDRGEPDFQGIRSCAPFAGRTLHLRDVKPWPAGTTPPSAGDYRAELVVGAGCSLR